MRLLIFTVMTLLSALSMADTNSPVVDTSVLNKTFVIPGPNCFSTALRVTKMVPTFRGVDQGEFAAIIKNYCQEVATPQKGDIGTYAFPNGGEFQHAFVYVNEEVGIEKAGVDYFGKSPVTENLLVHIDYIRLASMECRKYSKDISECSSVKRFYRCKKPMPPTDAQLIAHNALVAATEATMMDLIDGVIPKSQQMAVYTELEKNIKKLTTQLQEFSVLTIESAELEYYTERIESLGDQMIFIKNAIN